MRIVAFSDTHGQHEKVVLPEGDVLVFAGDMSMTRNDGQCERFMEWFGSQPHEYKVWTAGNHDFDVESGMVRSSPRTYFLNGYTMMINGVKFWGSPQSKGSGRWAYSANDEVRKEIWDTIPDDVQVLVTHGPAKSILDKVANPRPGEWPHVGCKHLRDRIKELPSLRSHIFGHIHESHGKEIHVDTIRAYRAFNVSLLDENYTLVNSPTAFDI